MWDGSGMAGQSFLPIGRKLVLYCYKNVEVKWEIPSPTNIDPENSLLWGKWSWSLLSGRVYVSWRVLYVSWGTHQQVIRISAVVVEIASMPEFHPEGGRLIYRLIYISKSCRLLSMLFCIFSSTSLLSVWTTYLFLDILVVSRGNMNYLSSAFQVFAIVCQFFELILVHSDSYQEIPLEWMVI
jgi:hypothetical protein